MERSIALQCLQSFKSSFRRQSRRNELYWSLRVERAEINTTGHQALLIGRDHKSSDAMRLIG